MNEEARLYAQFFKDATTFEPYAWQIRAAIEGLPEVLPIPTGLGKTEGSVLAWAWRKLRLQLDAPLHLVYCLPMRSLVRQTVERLNTCFYRLASKDGFPRISVYRLMGGAVDEEWARWPDRPWVLVGTQDQLLSRALNRGYAMSRFDWPVHFGLLNHDCHWIVDEVQLMGPGLWTTSQLDWMRTKRFPSAKPCRVTWMSATIGTSFLATTDRKNDKMDTHSLFDPELDSDESCELKRRRNAQRPVDWFAPDRGKKAPALHHQVAQQVLREHSPGTLTLVVCNTVRAAQDLFRALDDGKQPKILLTSRFRKCDRNNAEQTLTNFEAERVAATGGRIVGKPGLICVSTQVVEAGLDISAHVLWSELAPWPSVIQRLGRLNRDGKDNQAKAVFWSQPKPEKRKHDGETWIGPYREQALKEAKALLEALRALSASASFAEAMDKLASSRADLLRKALEPRFEPHPRALDVHGLFSTEPDMHGGFTDVSRFVRDSDPDADVTVFWREWSGAVPPQGDELEGPPFRPEEGCPVVVGRVREALRGQPGTKAWIWSTKSDQWEACAPNDLAPGMVLMLHACTGGYSKDLGWTGLAHDKPRDVPLPGPGKALHRDERVQVGYWAHLDAHLADSRAEAELLCDGVGLSAHHEQTKALRAAVVEAAAFHDLGKLYPDWQRALPAGEVIGDGPWAKCPHVLRVEPADLNAKVREQIASALPAALALAPKQDQSGRAIGLRWALDRKLKREELEHLRGLKGVRKAVNEAFRPGLRHEAASALAMWHRYRKGGTSYPALAVYLAAAHHGKVRTILRSITDTADDVFGVSADAVPLQFNGEEWPMDHTVAFDGADGEWIEEGFVISGHGWTGLVADLLGPWRAAAAGDISVGAVPAEEPRHLGPFVLAWLEALVRIADWRASEKPSQRVKPSEVVDAG